MSESTPEKHMQWKSIKIPAELYNEISRIAHGGNEAMWKTLLRAWSFWYSAYKSHFNIEATATNPQFDKAMWYIFKLVNSVGEFKASPFKQLKYEQLMRTVDQIERRFKIDCSVLKLAIDNYMKRRSKSNKTALNDATKHICVKIIQSITQPPS